MAFTNSTIKATQALADITPATRNLVAVYADLFKARLTFLVLLTTLVGFYIGSTRGAVDYVSMFHTVFGTAMVASGAAALNHLLEREFDARMRRTRNRPLPAGHLAPRTVLWVGLTTGIAGMVYLALFANLLAGLLGAISFATYVLVYTPLKRVTWLNTIVGTIPGGLPPLIGWAGAKGTLGPEALPLFCILAFWQIPHFLAIAWMYRDEYERAGFKMLPAFDPTGRRTGRQALVSALVLLVASACPFFMGLAGGAYLVGALILGASFAWFAVQFRASLSLPAARKLFFASILYLPLVLSMMVLDKM